MGASDTPGAIQILSRQSLSGEQQEGIMVVLRVKWGRKLIDPMLKEDMPARNQKFGLSYIVEETYWLHSNDKLILSNYI